MMMVSLATTVEDPIERLRAISASANHGKKGRPRRRGALPAARADRGAAGAGRGGRGRAGRGEEVRARKEGAPRDEGRATPA
jgi:hypothetical protein